MDGATDSLRPGNDKTLDALKPGKWIVVRAASGTQLGIVDRVDFLSGRARVRTFRATSRRWNKTPSWFPFSEVVGDAPADDDARVRHARAALGLVVSGGKH